MEPMALRTVHKQTALIYPIIPFQFFCPLRWWGQEEEVKKGWGEKENKSVIKNIGVTGGG